MRIVRWTRLWCRALLRRDRVERDMERELAFHLERETELNVARGMPLREARRAALVAFGGVEQTKDAVRDERRTLWLEQTLGDVRFSFRSLRRRPAFAIVGTLTIALAIGATTAIYTIVDTVLFHGIPASGTGQLVAVWQTIPSWRTQPVLASSWDHSVVDYPDFRNWRDRQQSFFAVGAFRSDGVTLWSNDRPQGVFMTKVSPSFFRVLGIVPTMGRLFLPGEDVFGGPKVTVLSYDAWQTRFGARADIIGRTVLLDSISYTIVGVLPKNFAIARGVAPRPFFVPAGQIANDLERGNHSYRVIARLKPHVTFEQAETEAKQLLGDARRGARVVEYQLDQTRVVRAPLLLLLAASAMLVLIATLNIATLLLGEAATREHEMSARVALGASRGRLVRQMLTESTVLASVGATVGIALAWWMIKILRAIAPANVPGIQLAHIDGRALAVTTLVTVLAGMLFGLAPAVSLSVVAPSDLLRGGRNLTSPRARLSNILMIAQVALSVVLLLSATLVSRSLRLLSQVDLGFRGDHLAVVSTDYPYGSFKTTALRQARVEAIAERLAALPGVRAVSAASTLPFDGGTATTDVELPGDEALGARAPRREANRRFVMPNLFSTLGIPVLAGRTFVAADRAGAPPVIIVSEALARREWPNETALGKQVRLQRQWRTVVGVVGDTKLNKLTDEAEPTFYVPLAQSDADVRFLVKTSGDPAQAAPMIRAAVAEASPLSEVNSIQPMTELVRASMAEERFRTTLIDLFGAMAMLLAGIGLYGLTARMIARRMREAGIRIALGATASSVSRLMVRRSISLVVFGAAFGLAAAVPVTRVLQPYLYGVTKGDPVAYAATVVLLASVALLASALPARRLRRVSPTTVLRAE